VVTLQPLPDSSHNITVYHSKLELDKIELARSDLPCFTDVLILGPVLSFVTSNNICRDVAFVIDRREKIGNESFVRLVVTVVSVSLPALRGASNCLSIFVCEGKRINRSLEEALGARGAGEYALAAHPP
jgi:hypothetical protein